MRRKRQPKIAESQVKELLLEGKTQSQVADVLDCSRRTIGIKKRHLEKQGVVLPVHRMGRQKQSTQTVSEQSIPSNGLTLEQAEEILLQKFEDAKKVPALEAELWELKNRYAALRNAHDNLERYYNEKEKRTKRFKLAQQQGEIGGLPGIAQMVADFNHDLTYHI